MLSQVESSPPCLSPFTAQLPQLGPLGANGLANPRDFKYPVAAFQDLERPFRLLNKYGGELFEATLPASPFNVVAWHGNYAPFKYNLDDFCCVGSVTYDHLVGGQEDLGGMGLIGVVFLLGIVITPCGLYSRHPPI